MAAQSVCVELRVHRDLVQSSPASAAAEHIQPSLDVTPWDTRSAQLANSSYRHDKRYRLRVSRAPGVAFGVRLMTPAGAALRSLASPALAVDRKVEPRPSQALSVSAMHA